MKIYDGHMHIGGSSAPDPRTLINKLEECGIYGGNVISIDPDDVNFTYEQRVGNLFEWVKGYEDRLFPVAWLHPLEKNVLEKAKELNDMGVAAFKFIPNNYSVRDEKAVELFSLIEEMGKPIIFHTGILFDFMESSQYNKPLDHESFVRFKSLRFSLGHCSYPWYDESISVYGKFRWIDHHTQRAAAGESTIYYNHPWVLEHIIDGKACVPQAYLDTTPGAHGLFRRDMLRKFVSCYPDGENIFFGTDSYVEEYDPTGVAALLKTESDILDEAGATESFREKMYSTNVLEFIGKR